MLGMLSLASMASLFAGIKGGLTTMEEGASDAGLSIRELAAIMAPSKQTGSGRPSKLWNPIREAKRFNGAYHKRQQEKRRHEEGLALPKDVQEARDAYVVRRGAINARRYRAWMSHQASAA